jgi:hypothetical protein
LGKKQKELKAQVKEDRLAVFDIFLKKGRNLASVEAHYKQESRTTTGNSLMYHW